MLRILFRSLFSFRMKPWPESATLLFVVGSMDQHPEAYWKRKVSGSAPELLNQSLHFKRCLGDAQAHQNVWSTGLPNPTRPSPARPPTLCPPTLAHSTPATEITAPPKWQEPCHLQASAPILLFAWNAHPSGHPPSWLPQHFQIPAHRHLLSEPFPDHSPSPENSTVLWSPRPCFTLIVVFITTLYCILY